VFYVLDRRSGDVVWQAQVGKGGVGGGMRGEASIGKDRIFAWSNNEWNELLPPKPPPAEDYPITIKALDLTSGREVWAKPGAQPAIGWGSGALASETYFVGSLDGRVRGYRATDGERLWTSPQLASIGSSLVVSGNALIFGTGVIPDFGDKNAPQGKGVTGVFAFTVPAGDRLSQR
jgi:outer membrane protein assembly factor BamB